MSYYNYEFSLFLAIGWHEVDIVKIIGNKPWCKVKV